MFLKNGQEFPIRGREENIRWRAKYVQRAGSISKKKARGVVGDRAREVGWTQRGCVLGTFGIRLTEVSLPSIQDTHLFVIVSNCS